MSVSGFEQVDLSWVGEQWGTPLYVVSVQQLRANVAQVSAALPGTRLLYSLKTNYLPAITRQIRALGLGIDVVSGFELQAALDSGFSGAQIVFNGPVKRPGELALAVQQGVFINIDGPQEIDVLAALAARSAGRVLEVGLRVYPPGDVYSDDPRKQRALPSKFGWPTAGGGADEIVDRILQETSLRITGVHVHLGSQITSESNLLAVLEPVLTWTALLRERTELTRFNIGGGFGVPGIHRIKGAVAGLSEVQTATHQPVAAFDLAEFSLGLRRALAEHGLQDLRIYAEPGRALVSSAAILLTRVIAIKTLKDHSWVVLDGGLNLLPTAGVAELHRFTALRAAGRSAPYLVAGPLCYEGDVLGVNVPLPENLRIGDLVVIHDAGAYGFSRANSFNQLRAATVVVSAGHAELAWRAETYSDLMRLAVNA